MNFGYVTVNEVNSNVVLKYWETIYRKNIVKYFTVWYDKKVNFTEEKEMSEWIGKINWKYVIVMLIGNVILGLGIAIFKLSGLGNDPFSGMVMALSDRIGIDYPIFLIIVNMIIFVVEIIFGRKMIGLGTFVNALLLGYVVSFFIILFYVSNRLRCFREF